MCKRVLVQVRAMLLVGCVTLDSDDDDDDGDDDDKYQHYQLVIISSTALSTLYSLSHLILTTV